MDALLDMDQVSEILNTPKETIYGWRSQKKIPFIKIGRRALFHPQDVLEFILKNRIPAKN
jgi:excisionase family DNA binding protein